MALLFPDRWPVLDGARRTLNQVWENWIVRPFSEIKAGLQNLLEAVWAFPTTWRAFIDSLEKGFVFWYNKARDLIKPLATEVFNLLITPWRPVLNWWNAHRTIILGFFCDPLGYLKDWLLGLGGVLLRAIEIVLLRPPGYLKTRLLDLFDFLTNLWGRVKEFFNKTLPAWWENIVYWIGVFVRLSRDSKNYFLSFLRDPWGVFRSTLVSVLEGLGKMLYVLVLEFVDFIWRP